MCSYLKHFNNTIDTYDTLQTYQLCLVWCRGFGVAIGIQKHLGISVDGHKGLEVSVSLDKVHD